MTKRFENAVMKLYNAFHKGELNANDCTMCAVGNICDQSAGWTDISESFGSGILTKNKEMLRLGSKFILKTGYSPLEIVTIEKIFLYAVDWKGTRYNEKDNQFKGLCAVVEYLCKLDNIPNVMDYKWLFESEENKPEKVFSHVSV